MKLVLIEPQSVAVLAHIGPQKFTDKPCIHHLLVATGAGTLGRLGAQRAVDLSLCDLLRVGGNLFKFPHVIPDAAAFGAFIQNTALPGINFMEFDIFAFWTTGHDSS